MGKLELIQQLRQTLGALAPVQENWAAPHLPAGVARGILVELLGNARTEWLLALFALHPKNLIFWCEDNFHINPVAFEQRGVRLERVKFVCANNDFQQVLRLAFESQHYPFIVAPVRFTHLKIYQRLHLLAEKSKSTLFLLADHQFSSAWPVSLQLNINSFDNQFKIDVQKNKYRTSG